MPLSNRNSADHGRREDGMVLQEYWMPINTTIGTITRIRESIEGHNSHNFNISSQHHFPGHDAAD
jgi:hypothetical protein